LSTLSNGKIARPSVSMNFILFFSLVHHVQTAPPT
jgi:hypothetical protein